MTFISEIWCSEIWCCDVIGNNGCETGWGPIYVTAVIGKACGRCEIFLSHRQMWNGCERVRQCGLVVASGAVLGVSALLTLHWCFQDTALYCIVMYCTVLYCMYCMYCTVLYCTVLYCTVLLKFPPFPSRSVFPSVFRQFSVSFPSVFRQFFVSFPSVFPDCLTDWLV